MSGFVNLTLSGTEKTTHYLPFSILASHFFLFALSLEAIYASDKMAANLPFAIKRTNKVKNVPGAMKHHTICLLKLNEI